MREWQVGDPVGDGNDIGVPDTKYMGYLRKDNENNQSRNTSTKDIELSFSYSDEAFRLADDGRYDDALTFINVAIEKNPNEPTHYGSKAAILYLMGADKLESGYYDDALKIADEAFPIIDDEKSHPYACFLYLKACVYSAYGDYNKSLKYCNRALEISPNEKAFNGTKKRLLDKIENSL